MLARSAPTGHRLLIAEDDRAVRDSLARAHELGGPVLVTGSLYLLGDLVQAEREAAWPA